jgi:ketosteroid isomerase-like protein
MPHPSPFLPPCITGAESVESADSSLVALVHFYRAFNQRDLVAMERAWLPGDEPSMDNPIGGIRRSWPEIRGGYEKLFGGRARVYVEFHDYSLQGDDHYALAVGRERGWFEQDGTRIDLAIRTSRLFVKRDGSWRQLHHHGSIEDGQLLADYQRAVLGAPVKVGMR